MPGGKFFVVTATSAQRLLLDEFVRQQQQVLWQQGTGDAALYVAFTPAAQRILADFLKELVPEGKYQQSRSLPAGFAPM